MVQRLSDDGFSLVEVVLAMFLLGLMALAVLPLSIGAMRTSVVNRDVVAATAFADSRIALLRDAYRLDAATSSCTALAATPPIGAADAQAGAAAKGMTATVTAVCPASAITTALSVAVTVTVTDSTGATIVAVPTTMRVTRP
jgi:prepilin-type N-terminal cleavage/methylation domain-containing protein